MKDLKSASTWRAGPGEPSRAAGQRHQASVVISRGCHTRDLNVFLTKSDVNHLYHTSQTRRFKMPSLEFPEPMTFYPTLEEWKDLPR